MNKNCFILLGAFIFLQLIVSCKDDEPGPTSFSNTPEAKAVNDNKSGGVYKGVLMGSSGTIKIVLQDGTISVTITFDGVTKTLTSSSLGSWTSGQEISNATFSAGDWEVIFSVDADGSNPQITVSIPNHTIHTSLIKETSDMLIRAFEGTYSRSDGTTFALNCVIKGDQVRFPGLSSVGSLSGNNITLNAPEKDFTLSGTISADKITGTGSSVEVSNTGTTELPGTWAANRTL